MKLTDQQMLNLWRQANNLETARNDCSIEVFEGFDYSAAIITAMRQWYLTLLDTAPLQYLQTSDITSQIALTSIGNGVWQFELGADVRRLIAIQIEGCAHLTNILTFETAKNQIALNTNRLIRSGINNPLAYKQGNKITIYCRTTNNSTPKITSTIAITGPGDEWYIFNESAISLIPHDNTFYE